MISLRIRAALSALVLALLTAPTPAQARPADSGTLLRLTVQGAMNSPSRTATLTCDPVGGSHPDPAAACAALDGAGGDPERLKGTPGVLCNDLYQPVTAIAEGAWARHGVSWQHEFANSCGLHTKTGTVFNF